MVDELANRAIEFPEGNRCVVGLARRAVIVASNPKKRAAVQQVNRFSGVFAQTSVGEWADALH